MSALAGYTTLLDIAKANGSDQVTGLIDETTRLTPEVRMGAARTISGTSYKTWVRTGLPANTFRDANSGSAIVKSQYNNRIVETFTMNPQWEIDRAVADRFEFGAAAYIAEEAQAIMESAIQGLGRQFFYGRNQYVTTFAGDMGMIPGTKNGANATYGGDLKGNPGLIDGYSTNYEKDAQGTTANSATSVWGVKWGNKNVSWVYGKNGQLNMSDVKEVRVTDSAGNPFTAYRQELLAYPGLQIGDLRGVLRILNITADAGHTLTDQLLYDAVSLVPAGLVPDCFFMTRRSLAQLRDSRTTFNPLGLPAPIPQSLDFGATSIPIYVTDSIANTEALNYRPTSP